MTLDRLYRDVENLKKQYRGLAGGPQLALSSIENGNIDVNDEDGNLVSTIGLQEDGSGATRFFDGPTPPVPAGFTALADGPLIQGTWDGSFEGGLQATYDLAYLEVAATLVDDDSRVSFATITAKEGASASVVANQSGLWAVAVRSVSQAGKKSEFASAGTVEVKLVDLAGAIEAVQDSANGKNKVTYSEHAPTPDDPGIFDDTWFVGQVGRPNDVVEATNLVFNPSFEIAPSDLSLSTGLASATQSTDATGIISGNYCLAVAGAASGIGTNTAQIAVYTSPGIVAGQYLGWGWSLRDASGSGLTVSTGVNWYTSGGSFISSEYQPYRPVPTALGRLTSSFLVPATAYRARMILRFRASNGTSAAPANFRVLTDGWIAVPGASESAVLAVAQTPFDGDTPSGATPNESHYRWTGTPHASTSEKYLPALDIGDSDNWNVIEQYRHDGTGWVKVELSHYVFSTVDLGKATVGELDGIRIMAKTIGTEQLRADFADFVVARGATLIAGNDRHRLDDNGYALFDANGDRRTFLSPDGSTFKGEVEADTLVVNQGAEFKATNTLAQGAKLTLAAGVTDPTAPPVVQPYWAGVEFTPPSGATPVGLAFDGTHYWTAESWPRFGAAWKIDAATGAAEQVSLPDAWGRIFGVTCIGSELYWLTLANHTSTVIVTDLNLAEKRKFEFEDIGFSSTNPLVYEPGIGTDGTNVLIAHCSDAGTLYLRTYDPTTGAKTATAQVEGFSNDVTGAFRGSADFGLDRTVVSRPTSYQLRVGGTDLAYDGTRSWDGPSDAEVAGFCWTGSRFASIGADGKITEYADPNTGDESGDWWAVYAWAEDWDGNGVTETWSRISPPKQFTWPRRAGIKFIGQPLPDGVQMILPAIAKKTTFPTRTDFHSPSWSFSEGRPVAWYNELPTDWASWPSPRDSNNFPDAEVSVIESASGTFHVDGAGAGWWGPLTFNTDGSLSGIPKMAHGTVVLTPPADNTTVTAAVTFPEGRFSTPPTVVVSADTTVPGTNVLGVSSTNISKTSFDAVLRRTNAVASRMYWIAMGE